MEGERFGIGKKECDLKQIDTAREPKNCDRAAINC